jgi:GT2 family glycosyltransferase
VNLGIVILTKGNLDYLFRCLSSIKQYTIDTEYTVYVADTGSSIDEQNQTVDYIKEHFKEYKNCKFYKLNYYNFARCNNFIIKEVVKEDHVLLCNNDIELMDDSIDTLMSRLVNDVSLGTVGCRLIYPQNGTIQHAGQFTRITRFGENQADPAWNRAPHLSCGHRGQHTNNTYSDWEPIMGNTGGFMMLKKDKYIEAGGLNEQYKVCFEDVEFNMMMIKQGFVNMYCDTVKCKHYESLTRKQGIDPADHSNVLTPFFNSLSMGIKKQLVELPCK